MSGAPFIDYRLEDSLGFLVNQASRAIRTRFNQELAARGLAVTGEQFAVLIHLWHSDGQYQKDLAATLAKDKPAMGRLVQALEAAGLVERRTDPDDHRHKRVSLTDLGRSSMQGLISAATSVLDEAARGVDPADLDVCKEVLRTVHQALTASQEGGEE